MSLHSYLKITMLGALVFLHTKPLWADDLKLDISPGVPHDYDIDKNNKRIPVMLTDRNAAIYAWNTFFALNHTSYPIDSGMRGQADPNKQFGDPGPTVWNTFKEKRELYRIVADANRSTGYAFDTSDPGDYSVEPNFARMSPNIGPCSGPPVNPNEYWNFMDESQEIGLATIWLKDAKPTSDNLVRTQVKMNQSYYDYIRNNQFYRTDVLNQRIREEIAPGHNKFGPVHLLEGSESDEGALLVKSSWVKYHQIPSRLRHDYYTVAAMYFESGSNGACYSTDYFSLIAVHFIHKTRSFPEFLYTTFENSHNRELPFVYANTLGTASTLPNAYNVPYCHPPTPQPGLQDPPYPVYQINPTRDIISKVNGEAYNQMNLLHPHAVWKNYALVGLQYVPVDGPSDSRNMSQDFYLANPYIETSQRFQSFTGTFTLSSSVNVQPHPYNDQTSTVQMGGCMGCHGAGAQGAPYNMDQIVAGSGGTDFSFILLGARYDPVEQGVETLKTAVDQITPGQKPKPNPWYPGRDLPFFP